jgi:hypothetical protein
VKICSKINDALKATGVGYWTRNSIKWGVKLFGNSAWKKNCKERTKGYPRLIPIEYWNFPIETRWNEYRKILMDKKITSSPTIKYCEE